MKVYAQQNDTLDLIAYRYFGQTQGIVEQLIQLNPHLITTETLPTGTPVDLPEHKAEPVKKLINLWS